ncbi:hypothetical protein PL78_18030 [Yersinia entomophaga]|uniref:Uncharacterized protein n=1 Tax=Yersinia entomophaga TaxID=935293 RepID=A0ABN4PXG0_YERET|nr:hypothetical protein PL78_18030 [Yersinia entomophaga]OWF85005.1 hypothetical protein B4914_18220 [Yersinia entomophaga]
MHQIEALVQRQNAATLLPAAPLLLGSITKMGLSDLCYLTNFSWKFYLSIRNIGESALVVK